MVVRAMGRSEASLSPTAREHWWYLCCDAGAAVEVEMSQVSVTMSKLSGDWGSCSGGTARQKELWRLDNDKVSLAAAAPAAVGGTGTRWGRAYSAAAHDRPRCSTTNRSPALVDFQFLSQNLSTFNTEQCYPDSDTAQGSGWCHC